MSDKINDVNCVPYVTDYKQVVHEIREMLYKQREDLKEKLQDEKSPIKYIELNAVLTNIKQLNEHISYIIDCYQKPVEFSSVLQEENNG